MRGNEKKKPPPFFRLSLHLISLLHSRGESATRVESEMHDSRTALVLVGWGLLGGQHLSMMATDRGAESGPDSAACSRRDWWLPVATESIFVSCLCVCVCVFELIHVNQLQTTWPRAWCTARLRGNTRTGDLIRKWAGGRESSHSIGRHSCVDKMKEMAGEGKVHNKSLVNTYRNLATYSLYYYFFRLMLSCNATLFLSHWGKQLLFYLLDKSNQ